MAPAAQSPSTMSADAATLSLEQVMRALSLGHAAGLLDESAQRAIARAETPVGLLATLMREQLRHQVESRARLALRRSSIFPLTSLSTCDFDDPKQIDHELCLRAVTLEFLKEKTKIVFVGPSGVGKTHLANALGQLARLQGFRVKFVIAADLVNHLVAAQACNGLARALTNLGCLRAAPHR